MYAFFRQIAAGDRSSGGEQTRLEWSTSPSLPNEANHNAGSEESCIHLTFFAEQK